MFATLFPPPPKEPEAYTQLKAKLQARKPGPPNISIPATAHHILCRVSEAEQLLQRRHDWMYAVGRPRELRRRNMANLERQIEMHLGQAKYLAEHLAKNRRRLDRRLDPTFPLPTWWECGAGSELR